MAVDPDVQVALVSVFATGLTTLGVVITATITNRKDHDKVVKADVEDLDERDIVERLLFLLDDNQRKELTIAKLRKRNRELGSENNKLRAQLLEGGLNGGDAKA